MAISSTHRLLKIIHYADCLELASFTQIAGPFFSSANLNSADLTSANLYRVNLKNADLTYANLANANLEGTVWNEYTRWEGVQGLETARNVPEGRSR